MPEGDTVWRVARRLDETLSGHALTSADLRVPRHATAALAGQTVVETASRGKHLLTRTDRGLTLHSHLGMEGSWRIFSAGQRWSGGPGWQVRAVLQSPTHCAVGYRLARLDLLRTSDEHRLVGHLGPDLLGPDWDPDEAVRRLASRPDREIGEALLDQRNLAGIGNIYKAECLFVCGVSPWLPVAQVPDLTTVVVNAQQLLDRNRDAVRRVTADPGDLPRPARRDSARHWVFDRAGRPCRRCGTPVAVAHQGEAPRHRVTYWCRRCQPGPAPVKTRLAAQSRP